ncbi:ras protein [Venturia nashicola]|nr:ras protein [Venturia nashicola]
MDAVALPLAFPAILTGIRKFVAHFNSTDTRIETLVRKCRVLERAVSQLAEISGKSHSDPLMDEIIAECSQVIKSMEFFMTECVPVNTSPSKNKLSKTARLNFLWRNEDLNTLMTRVDDCRANVQLFLIMTIPRSQAQLLQSNLTTSTKVSRRHSSIIQSDDDTLRFSFLSNNSRFSTTTLNINPDRSSAATIEFAFDQDIQSSRAYRRNFQRPSERIVINKHDIKADVVEFIDTTYGPGVPNDASHVFQNLSIVTREPPDNVLTNSQRQQSVYTRHDSHTAESLDSSDTESEEDMAKSPFSGSKPSWRDSTSLPRNMFSPGSPWQHSMPMIIEASETQSDQAMIHKLDRSLATERESVSQVGLEASSVTKFHLSETVGTLTKDIGLAVSVEVPRNESTLIKLARAFDTLKILVLGSRCSGKSGFSASFLGRYDPDHADDTIIPSSKQFKCDEVVFWLSLSVPAARGAFFTMDPERKKVVCSANGFVLVYSTASRLSFDSLMDEYMDCLRYNDDYVDCARYNGKGTFPAVVVEINDEMGHVRAVSTHEGMDWARTFGCQFVQVSRIDNEIDVCRCFEVLLRQIGEWNEDEEAWKRRGILG